MTTATSRRPTRSSHLRLVSELDSMPAGEQTAEPVAVVAPRVDRFHPADSATEVVVWHTWICWIAFEHPLDQSA